MLTKPERLESGDHVGIFVPSSPVKIHYRDQGQKQIKELGYVPVEVEEILSKKHLVAKHPDENLNDIQKLFSQREIKALWAARGGYGSNYLLPMLEKLEIPEPKIVIGSSDVSYLLWYLLDKRKMVVFYGPMVYSTLAENRADLNSLKSVLNGKAAGLRVCGKVLRPGYARAMITGGCLSNFVSLIGTDYIPEVRQRVLFLEDVNEKPHRIDRMFWQLFETGIFSKIKGLVLGEFPFCFRSSEEKTQFFGQIGNNIKKFDFPIIYDLPFGHAESMFTLPLGVEVELDLPSFEGLVILEDGVL